jgi:type VI secretion system protein VasJ
LEEWDPSLALKGLKMVLQGFSTLSDESVKDQTSDVLKRIAKLDPAEALMFSKR